MLCLLLLDITFGKIQEILFLIAYDLKDIDGKCFKIDVV